MFNSVVDADHDLGNAYIYVTESAAGNLVLYAAAERLGTGDSSIEFEFNQGKFVLGHGGYGEGRPWEVVGEREPGDLLLRLSFGFGELGSVEAWAWGGEEWLAVTSAFGEGCVTATSSSAPSAMPTRSTAGRGRTTTPTPTRRRSAPAGSSRSE